MDTVHAYEAEASPQEKNMQAFLDACEGKETNICTATEGAQLQKVIEAIFQSAKV